MDHSNAPRRQADTHRSPASPIHQSLLDRRLPDRPQPDPAGWVPPRAASPPLSIRSSNSEQIPMPNWARDHSISLHPRPSRASSIVSTRTKASINTIQEDTRSIDIVLGAQSFHINRDGSKISVTNKEELPPYSSPALSIRGSNIETPTSVQLHDQTPSPETPRGDTKGKELEDLHKSHETAETSAQFSDPWQPRKSSDDEPPWIVSTPTNVDDFIRFNAPGHASERQRHIESASSPKKTEESRIWQSLPVKSGLGGGSLNKNRRSVSQGNLHDAVSLMDGARDTIPWLRRRYSVRLPKIMANESGGKTQRNRGTSGDSELDYFGDPVTRPAEPGFGKSHNKSSAFPAFSERGSRNKLVTSPSPRTSVTIPRFRHSSSAPSIGHLAVPESPVHVEEGHADSDAPPPMESDNDISIHYTRLIRSIDRDHRRALHQRDKELAAMRERLNEVDQVYRQELKARDFTIDDLKSRLTSLEDNMQSRIEKAQHDVEDLWEMRWKDRDRHLMERMRRIELDSQKCVEQAVAERDEEWGVEWARKNEQLLERLKVAEGMKGDPPSS
ncbi:hypothetical protein FQN54_001065 [Arachnomyces sp. PD_36]|nr:hypothetical protein FQN54_001065 [Arachnomyces sp. PD_36]